MAYWGEAMSYDMALWDYQDRDKGIAVLSDLDVMLAGADPPTLTSLESSLIGAVRKLYQNGTRSFLSQAFYTAMKSAVDAFPSQYELLAFYSLGLLRYSLREDRGYDDYGVRQRWQAQTIVKSLLKRAPNHPGGLHMLVHAFDDPQNATFARDYALRFPTVAPDSNHALHMATHALMRTGEWSLVVSYNAKAITMAATKGLDLEAHAILFQHYALLQKGQFQSAWKALAQFNPPAAGAVDTRSTGFIFNEALAKALYVVETAFYGGDLCKTVDLPADNLNCSTCAANIYTDGNYLFAAKTNAAVWFAKGYCAYFTGGFGGLDMLPTYMARLEELSAMIADDFTFTSKSINIMRVSLQSLHTLGNGDVDSALNLIRGAVGDEQDIDPSPPGIPYPLRSSYEIYAYVLSANGQHLQAGIDMVNLALANYPNKTSALIHRYSLYNLVGYHDLECQDYRTLINVNFKDGADPVVHDYLENAYTGNGQNCVDDGTSGRDIALIIVTLVLIFGGGCAAGGWYLKKHLAKQKAPSARKFVNLEEEIDDGVEMGHGHAATPGDSGFMSPENRRHRRDSDNASSPSPLPSSLKMNGI
eukprot:GILK01005568.1.p1 GENE.GILK01005568.1~~GILK01005568.1.p1  ORF type:complete len:588 (-),score=90.37 GILK01005568.1:147-1910(-)